MMNKTPQTSRTHSTQAYRGSVLILAVTLSACSATIPATTSPRTGPSLIGPEDKVLVLPLRDGSCLPVYGDHVKCHLTGEHLNAGVVPEGTGFDLAEILFEKLQALGVSLVPYAVGTGAYSVTDPDIVDRYQPELAILTGRKVGADKVIMGIATSYEERSGSRFGAQAPAAVAFSLAIIDVASGKATHRFYYDYRQAPLTTDLLNVPLWWRMGIGWWTRKQISEETMSEAALALIGRKAARKWTNMPTGPPVQGFDDWTDHVPATPDGSSVR